MEQQLTPIYSERDALKYRVEQLENEHRQRGEELDSSRQELGQHKTVVQEITSKSASLPRSKFLRYDQLNETVNRLEKEKAELQEGLTTVAQNLQLK